MSNLYAILYNSTIKILFVICLHFIKDQYIILALLVASARLMIYLIYDNKFLLFINNKSIKIISYKVLNIIYYLKLIVNLLL